MCRGHGRLEDVDREPTRHIEVLLESKSLPTHAVNATKTETLAFEEPLRRVFAGNLASKPREESIMHGNRARRREA